MSTVGDRAPLGRSVVGARGTGAGASPFPFEARGALLYLLQQENQKHLTEPPLPNLASIRTADHAIIRRTTRHLSDAAEAYQYVDMAKAQLCCRALPRPLAREHSRARHCTWPPPRELIPGQSAGSILTRLCCAPLRLSAAAARCSRPGGPLQHQGKGKEGQGRAFSKEMTDRAPSKAQGQRRGSPREGGLGGRERRVHCTRRASHVGWDP